MFGQRAERGSVDGRRQEPCHQQHRDSRKQRAGHRVDGLAGTPGEPVAQRRTDCGGGDLPDQGEYEDDQDADDGTVGLGSDQPCERRSDVRAQHAATEKTDEGQCPDDEALPVAGHAKDNHRNEQDDVEHVEHGWRPAIR